MTDQPPAPTENDRQTADNVAIVILAAGAARRMGQDKLLLPVNGLPLLRHAALAALGARVPVLAVLPAGRRGMARQAALTGLSVRIVRISETRHGMGASLSAGLAALPQKIAAAVVSLADMPAIDAAAFRRLITAWQSAPACIHRGATEDGRPGHPVVLPRALFADRPFHGDQGARDLLRERRDLVRLVPLPGNAARCDIDTPVDWQAWQRRENG